MPPNGEGVGSTYDDKHLERLKQIKELQKDDMPLNKIRDTILNNPKNIKHHKKTYESAIPYIRENVCDVFEMHYTAENAEKYSHIIENVKKYVKKMMED